MDPIVEQAPDLLPSSMTVLGTTSAKGAVTQNRLLGALNEDLGLLAWADGRRVCLSQLRHTSSGAAAPQELWLDGVFERSFLIVRRNMLTFSLVTQRRRALLLLGPERRVVDA